MERSDTAPSGKESIHFYGHPLIRASHETTFEVTRESHLTKRGDCIVGVKAESACKDLNRSLKRLLRFDDARVEIEIVVNGIPFTARAWGSPFLTVSHEKEIVVRKSTYTSPRTLAVRCDKAAIDLPEDMKMALRKPQTRGVMKISAHR